MQASMRQHSVAFQRADSDAETRLAGNGRRYTKAEIIEYYTYDGQRIWDELGQMPTAQHRPWVNSTADSSAWPTADANSSAPSSSHRPWVNSTAYSSRWPTGDATSSAPSGSSQLTDTDAGSRAVEDGRSGATTDASHAVHPTVPTTSDAYQLAASSNSDDTALALRPLPLLCLPQVVLTCAELEAMPRVNGHGGKFAWARQRELRAELLRLGTYGHDLTHEAWPWRDVIRSLPEGLRTALVGPGVTMFAFKLLRGHLDQNYARKPGDTGERHVFHIARADGVAHLLHYHKNGTYDDPAKTAHNMIEVTCECSSAVCTCSTDSYDVHQRHVTNHDYTSALQPVVFDEEFITGPTVGRKEAATACTTLLEHCAGPRAASVDVTDELAFPWRRWLLNATNGEEARRGNIVKVFICRLTQNSEPCIACCRADETYVCIYPGKELYAKRALTLPIHNDWPAQILFHYPYFVTVMWNRISATNISASDNATQPVDSAQA